MYDFYCTICGKKFVGDRKNNRFCSNDCRVKYYGTPGIGNRSYYYKEYYERITKQHPERMEARRLRAKEYCRRQKLLTY